MKSKKRWIKIPIIVLLATGFVLTLFFLNESISQWVNMIILLVVTIFILNKGLEMEGISQILTAAMPSITPVVIQYLSKSEFASNMSSIYDKVIEFIFKTVGINKTVDVTSETSITITFAIIIFLFIVWKSFKDNTAMKKLEDSYDEEFREKNYSEKSEMFCKTLRQRLESLNRESDWSENLFTPVEAEVEVCTRGKRKKKYTDLLKSLKSIKNKGSIFLVLGEPGAGKSVSLRKLCLELLDESKKTKKIPIYINLKKWNKDWNLEHLPNKKDLTEFIRTILYENGDISADEFLDKYFDKMLEDGRWYFVFDSFDEMPCLMGKQNCQELIEKISELLCQFMKGPNQSGGIIASRLYKSPSEALGATVTLKIKEFSDIKIKTMIKKYLNDADLIVKELFGKREDLVVLCRNPFYLSLLISYARGKGASFPKNQMELYSSFVEERLKKCAGKLESENLTKEDVHNGAKQLAVFMQSSTIYGLECPMCEFAKRYDEKYIRKVVKLLEYAKICRMGGEEENISFVHRRFQEFFLVENIIEEKYAMGYAEYKNIINNSGMRDALVLYCEVSEEEKAKEIAQYCWNMVKNNITFSHNIQHRESIELVNTLYFMAEAFRNRKEVISEFETEFESLVEEKLDDETDFVVLLALTNCMVLFGQEYLQNIVLKVFKLGNRWLSDVVMQNCRIIDRLNESIEKQFLIYFAGMDMYTFLERFRNIQFSLSLSKSFRYIRVAHFIIFLIEISSLAIVSLIGVFILFHYEIYIKNIIEIVNGLRIQELFVDSNSNIEIISEDKSLGVYILLFLYMVFLIPVVAKISEIIRKQRIYFFTLVTAIMIIVEPIEKILGYTLELAFISEWLILGVMLVVRDIYGIKKIENIKRICKQIVVSVSLCTIYVGLILLAVTIFSKTLLVVMLIILAIVFLVFIISCGHKLLHYIKDIRWIKKQPDLKCISREQLTDNLKKLHISKCKCEYIEKLLQKKVELTGQWPNDIRPKSTSDRLERILAELDCAKIESCTYIF